MITDDHRTPDGPSIITGEDQMTITKWQILGPISIQCIDPPVLGIGNCAAT
jgi:hypothetical protein